MRFLEMPRRLALVALAFSLSAPAAEPGKSEVVAPARPSTSPLVERFRLFPDMAPPAPPPLDVSPSGESKRYFHQSGDPDSLFTFGKATPQGELRLKAAFEVNEITLKAIAPDFRVDPSDTRPRAGGDYRALDAGGRPYQLRLGARLVW
jgi:hypothetical protein